MRRSFHQILFAFLSSAFLGLFPLACGQSPTSPAPTPTPVNTPTITPTPTITNTPIPTPAYPTCTNTSTPTLIDDMEDNNTQVLFNQCRNGYWFTYNDGSGGIQTTGGISTGAITMANSGVGYNGTGTSLHSMEVATNTGFNLYGAGFGFSFLAAISNYDAYGFNGFQYYAKNSPGPVTVAFQVIDGPVANSSFHVGPHSTYPVLTSSWQLFQVSMNQLNAAGNSYVAYGYSPTVFDPSQLQQVEWQVQAATASDIWVDNFSFY